MGRAEARWLASARAHACMHAHVRFVRPSQRRLCQRRHTQAHLPASAALCLPGSPRRWYSSRVTARCSVPSGVSAMPPCRSSDGPSATAEGQWVAWVAWGASWPDCCAASAATKSPSRTVASVWCAPLSCCQRLPRSAVAAGGPEPPGSSSCSVLLMGWLAARAPRSQCGCAALVSRAARRGPCWEGTVAAGPHTAQTA